MIPRAVLLERDAPISSGLKAHEPTGILTKWYPHTHARPISGGVSPQQTPGDADWLQTLPTHPDADAVAAGCAAMTTRVEDLKPEALVQGLVGREAVFIVTAEMLGDAACKVVYRGHDGAPGEQLLFRSLGARRLRDDLNHFLRVEKPHVRVRDLVDWCRKYLYLPRVSTDQAILHALINPSAALSGESTFHLADGFDEASGRYCGLRTQQASSTQPTSLTGYFVKEEVALAQIEADRTKPVDPAPPGPGGGEERAHRSRTRMKERGHRGLVGLHHRLRPPPPVQPKAQLPTRSVASVNSNPPRPACR